MTSRAVTGIADDGVVVEILDGQDTINVWDEAASAWRCRCRSCGAIRQIPVGELRHLVTSIKPWITFIQMEASDFRVG